MVDDRLDDFHRYEDRYAIVKDFARYDPKVRYWDVNPNRRAETVVLLHGVGGSLEIWTRNVAYLSTFFRVITFDFPGHGKSDFIDDKYIYNTVSMVDFVAKFIETLQLPDRITVVAHSVGGMVGTYFSMRYQNKVKRLILVSSAGYGKQVGLKYHIATIKPLGELGFTKPAMEYTRRSAKAKLPQNELMCEEYIDQLFTYISATAGKPWLYSVRSEATLRGLARPFTADELAAIDIPVLVFWGDQDRSTPVKHLSHALRHIPDVRGVVLTGCGHRSQIGKHRQFNEIIKYFIKHNDILPYSNGQKCIFV